MIGKKIMYIIFMLMVCNTILFAEVSDHEILYRLNVHLDTIKSEYAFSRKLSGGILIGCGAIFGTLGIMLPLMIDDSSDDTLLIAGTFVVVGAGFGIGGTVALLLTSDYEKIPLAFAEMPESTAEEIKEKIVTGEVYLSSLAGKAKNQRLLVAGLTAASGMSSLIYYFYSTGPSNLRDTFLYEGVGLLSFSFMSFIIKSRPEEEYKSYRKWKKERGIVTYYPGERDRSFIIEPILIGNGIGFSLKYN